MDESETREVLVREIVSWLELVREGWATAAKKLGIPPSILERVHVAEAVHEHGMRGRPDTVSVSSATDRRLARSIRGALPPAGREAPSPAPRLFEQFGTRCRVWSHGIEQPAFEPDPTAWIEKVLLEQVLQEYLDRIAALDQSDNELAESLASGLLDLVEGDSVTHVTALPVGGIRFAQDPTTVQDVSFRKLSGLELGHLADARSSYIWSVPRPGPGAFPIIFEPVSERWVMEVRKKCPKDKQPMAGLLPEKMVLVLELLGFDVFGRGHSATWTEPGPSFSIGGGRIRLPRKGSTRSCSQKQLVHARAVADRIPDGAIVRSGNRNEVALHRFLLGSTEGNQEDAIIDYVTALEALLLPEKFEGELRFRLALFGAHLLGNDAAERGKLYHEIRAIYDVRSAIVHGTKPQKAETVSKAAQSARAISSRLLLYCLENGWPTQDELRDIALA
ncbi:MAG: HEPN domain-containing protein [Planctomycetota bacterium]|nr:HEPN domain-containing protein [Planctomycetota bacterium]